MKKIIFLIALFVFNPAYASEREAVLAGYNNDGKKIFLYIGSLHKIILRAGLGWDSKQLASYWLGKCTTGTPKKGVVTYREVSEDVYEWKIKNHYSWGGNPTSTMLITPDNVRCTGT